MTTTAGAAMTTSADELMVLAMCAAVDEGDAERFASWFAPDATYRFGNADPIRGHDAIVAATAGAVQLMPGLHHVVDQVARVGDQLFCRFTIEVPRPDTDLAMPCVTVIWQDADGLIVDYRVHMDPSPVFA
jgi:ketosteroid isomerase-like protein